MFPVTPKSIPFPLNRDVNDVLRRFLRMPFSVLLDSTTTGESYLSFAPTMMLQCVGQTADWQHGRDRMRLEGNPLDLFDRLERNQREECPMREPANGFHGGWMGLLGYDLRCAIETLPAPKPEGPHFPDLQAGFYPWVLVLRPDADPELRLLHGVPHAPDNIDDLAGKLGALLDADFPETPRGYLSNAHLHTDHDAWIAGVERVKHHIFEGDIYQANLTRMVSHAGTVDPVDLYLGLRDANPAPFAGYLDCNDGRAVISSSPERFVSVRDNTAETRPIKGTRARGDTDADDARIRDELLASEKDRAELTMIVDLERNDLSRVSRAGTVEVPSLFHAEIFRRVIHLEATIRGELRPNVTPVDLIRAMFPGGSITGAPKIRAMQIIHDLEPVRRSAYTGSLFRLGPGFDFDSNILIRTILREPDRVSYHVGGGIVADSDPEAEWHETLAKAQGVASALEPWIKEAR